MPVILTAGSFGPAVRVPAQAAASLVVRSDRGRDANYPLARPETRDASEHQPGSGAVSAARRAATPMNRSGSTPTRSNTETLIEPSSFGEDYPLSAVDEFTGRVEVTGVACCFNDHMQEDLAQVVEPPAAKLVHRPPGRWAV